jgi:hypothetical protein
MRLAVVMILRPGPVFLLVLIRFPPVTPVPFSILFLVPISPVTITVPVPIAISPIIIRIDAVLAMSSTAIIALLFFVLSLSGRLRLQLIILQAAFWGAVSISMSPDSLKYARRHTKGNRRAGEHGLAVGGGIEVETAEATLREE